MDNKALPNSGENLEIVATIGKNGFIRRKLPQKKMAVVILTKAEKQRSKLLKTRWAVTQAVKQNSEVAVLPSYGRLPSTEDLLRAKYAGGPDSAGGLQLEKHTLQMADFVSDIKADPELVLVWISAEQEASVEAQATDLMTDFGLDGEDYLIYRYCAEKVKTAIDRYNLNTSIPGSTVSPSVILAERKTRDKSILEACLSCQYLIVLFMDYGMLPAKYTRRQDFSNLMGDRKKISEKKALILKTYRMDAMAEYKKLKEEFPDVTFSFEKWNYGFLANL
jgi:hypothetical protein